MEEMRIPVTERGWSVVCIISIDKRRSTILKEIEEK